MEEIVVYNLNNGNLIVGSEGYEDDFWYQGIGGSGGLLETDNLVSPISYSRYLGCMSTLNERRFPIEDSLSGPCEKTLTSLLNRTESDYGINISPNPIQSFFQINNEDLGKYKLYILDLKGAIVFYKECENGELIISDEQISNLSSGVYTLFVETKSKGIGFQKILID